MIQLHLEVTEQLEPFRSFIRSLIESIYVSSAVYPTVKKMNMMGCLPKLTTLYRKDKYVNNILESKVLDM